MACCGKGGWDSGEIETKIEEGGIPMNDRGKGGWDSGEIETIEKRLPRHSLKMWKGWMGLRRD